MARFCKRPEIDPSGRLRMAMQPVRGPACARLCSRRLACTFSLKTNASSSVPSLHFLASIPSQSFLAARSSRSTPDWQPGVLNDRRRKPMSLRREANDGRKRELAQGLESKLADIAKSQYLDAWYQSLTSSLFFFAKELERTSSLSRLGTVVPDQRLSSREQHGRLGMCFL